MIAKFEEDYWQRKEKTINRVDTYKCDYLRHFLFLPQDQLLTSELLRQALNTSPPDSRKRKGMTNAYIALLNHFEIEHNLIRYRGSYKATAKRVIPTETEIDDYWQNYCKSAPWKWI